MITLIFVDCEKEYDNHIIIFFETLKNHVEDFGYLAKIDLTGIEITKEEFDNILNMCRDIVKCDWIEEIIKTDRQNKLEQYLGLVFEHEGKIELTSYCALHGLLNVSKYACENGCEMNENTCSHAAFGGHLECLKYARENQCQWNELTCSNAALNGHLDCLKYAHENGCKFGSDVCRIATYSGHYDCLKYAVEKGCYINIEDCIIFSDGICKKYLKNLIKISFSESDDD